MPIDVCKTRLQMDGAGGGVKMYNGTMDCAGKLVKSEGAGALSKGLPPALLRQSTYGSLRYGLYGPIRNSLGAQPLLGAHSLSHRPSLTRGAPGRRQARDTKARDPAEQEDLGGRRRRRALLCGRQPDGPRQGAEAC